MAKGEIINNKKSLVLTKYFQKLSVAEASESVCTWERVNNFYFGHNVFKSRLLRIAFERGESVKIQNKIEGKLVLPNINMNTWYISITLPPVNRTFTFRKFVSFVLCFSRAQVAQSVATRAVIPRVVSLNLGLANFLSDEKVNATCVILLLPMG